MGKIKNILGIKYGRLKVIAFVGKKPPSKHTYWECLCDCGNKTIVAMGNLHSNEVKSCGCLQKETICTIRKTHGEASIGKTITKEYRAWQSIKKRCYDKNYKKYEYYGGRGIIVCDRWLQSYDNFISDMGRSPSKKHSLDRENTNGNYEPNNCRWVIQKVQVNNARSNVIIELNGVIKTASEWGEFLGVKSSTIRMRIQRGWSKEKAITVPIISNKK